MPTPYVQTIIDLHPGVHYFLGKPQSGKSSAMQLVLEQWHGHSLAIDGVATNPPLRKHIARYSTWWTERMPTSLPPGTSLVACDECAEYTKEMDERAQPGEPGHLIYQLVRRSQHQLPHGVTSLLGSQRPMDIGPDAWGQAKTMTIFGLFGESDLLRVSKLRGMPKELVSWLPELPAGWAIVWHDTGRVEAPRCILEGGG